MSPQLRPLLPTIAILGAVFLWGSSFPAMKTALATLDIMTVMWIRMAVALLALLPFVGRLRLRFARRDAGRLAAMCLLMPCAYFMLEASALRLTTSVQAGLVSAMVPLLVALGAWPLLGERLTGRTLAGLAVSMAGVAGLTLAGSPGQTASNPFLGNLLELGAMACAAGSMLLMKDLSGRYGPWSLTGLQTAVGALFFLPGAPGVLRSLDAIAAGPWPVLLYLGAGVTLGAFGLYNWGMSRMEAGQASAYINFVPVAAALFGWLFLGETLTTVQLASAAAVLAGVHVSQSGSTAQGEDDSPAVSPASASE